MQSEVEDVFNELEPNKWYKAAVPQLAPEEDANSCYYSASATENYCSTDEHEGNACQTVVVSTSQVLQAALHSSDSGADISEQQVEESTAAACASGGERNNSLPDVLAYSDADKCWEHFWARNGESLIWTSWIEKYSEFIDPEFMGHQRKSNLCADMEVAAVTAQGVSS